MDDKIFNLSTYIEIEGMYIKWIEISDDNGIMIVGKCK